MRKVVVLLLLVALLALSTGVVNAGMTAFDPGCGKAANQSAGVDQHAADNNAEAQGRCPDAAGNSARSGK